MIRSGLGRGTSWIVVYGRRKFKGHNHLCVPCRSDQDQNWIKQSKPWLGANQGGLQAAKINGSRTCGRSLAFGPENQMIESLRREWSINQTHFLPIKHFDRSRKHFNRWHISDTPWQLWPIPILQLSQGLVMLHCTTIELLPCWNAGLVSQIHAVWYIVDHIWYCKLKRTSLLDM